MSELEDLRAEVAGWRGDSRKWKRATMAAESRVRALREGIEALLAYWEQHPMSDDYARVPADSLRALLSPSPAATTDEHNACSRRVESGVIHYACGVMIEVGTPDAYAMHVARWRDLPAPVSSGEAGTSRLADCVDHVAHCLNCGRGMNPGDAMCCPQGDE